MNLKKKSIIINGRFEGDGDEGGGLVRHARSKECGVCGVLWLQSQFPF